MKKICVITILILLVFCATVPLCAAAEGDAHSYTYYPKHGQYYLTSIVQRGEIIGVQFFGEYFGNSEIGVTVEIYSSPQLVLDFCIGDSDYGTSDSKTATLNAQQTTTKHFLIDIFEEINTFIKEIDACANTQYNGQNGWPLSDIYRYNSAKQGTKLEISAYTFEMLQLAREMYQDTSSAFNPAVYRLVDLWGFSTRIYSYGNFGLPYDRPVSADHFLNYGYPLPDEKYIAAFSDPQFTDFSEKALSLTQSDGKYFVTKNVAPAVVDGVEYDQWLDLGGIAKGYVVDCIKQTLQQQGLERYYVNAGESSVAVGQSTDGQQAVLGVLDPFENIMYQSTLLDWKTDPCSVSVSGQYIRKYTVNGVEYAHIVDGITGEPAQTGVKSILVSVPESEGLWAAKSDCLTTALTVMGKDAVVSFVNGYLKQRNITVVVVYETFDGQRQVLSNLPKEQIFEYSNSLNDMGWPLNQNEKGEWVYDETIKFDATPNAYTVTVIVLASIFGVGLVAVVVYHLVKGKKTALQKVQLARKDKPFKPADVGVYLTVVLVIVVLFAVFFGTDNQGFSIVEAVDIKTGEQLFYYNVARNEYKINKANSGGWQISVEQNGNSLVVTFQKEVDGEARFNVLTVVRGTKPTVKMTDALCGFHQDCVKNFGTITRSDGAIVCSPNRLKITTH